MTSITKPGAMNIIMQRAYEGLQGGVKFGTIYVLSTLPSLLAIEEKIRRAVGNSPIFALPEDDCKLAKINVLCECSVDPMIYGVIRTLGIFIIGGMIIGAFAGDIEVANQRNKFK